MSKERPYHLKPGERGTPSTVTEARGAANSHPMDEYHKGLTLWLCDEVERLQELLAFRTFDGEMVTAREAIRSELIRQGLEASERISEVTEELARLKAVNPEPIPKTVLLRQSMGEGHTLLGSLFLNAFTQAFPGNKIDSKQARALVQADEISLVLVANGIPMDAATACREWDKQVDRMIAEKAVELVEEQFSGWREIASQVEDSMRDFVRSFRNKIGLPPPEE